MTNELIHTGVVLTEADAAADLAGLPRPDNQDRRSWVEPASDCEQEGDEGKPTAPAETRPIYVAYTNTDCTEGRGYDVPVAVCEIEATATRLARKAYVQGSDGPVRQLELVKINGCWYAPLAAVNIIKPAKEDMAAQSKMDARRVALDKARASGLTIEDIQALGGAA